MEGKENLDKKYISLMEASELCDYSQEYLSLRARQKKLKAVKMGRNWVTTKEWLDEYIKQAVVSQKKEVAIPIKPGKVILGPTDVPEARTTSETLRKFWKKPITSKTIDTFSALIKARGDKRAKKIFKQKRKIVKSKEFAKLKAVMDKKARVIVLKTKQFSQNLTQRYISIVKPVIEKGLNKGLPWLEEKSISLFNVLKRKFVIIAKIVPQGLLISFKTDKRFVGFIIKGRTGKVFSGLVKIFLAVRDISIEGYKRLIENLSMFYDFLSVTFQPLETERVLAEVKTQKIEWRKLGGYVALVVLLVLISGGLVLGARGELTYNNVKRMAEQTMAGVGKSFYVVLQGEAPEKVGQSVKNMAQNTTDFVFELPQTGKALARRTQSSAQRTKTLASNVSKASLGGVSRAKIIILSGFSNLSDTLSDTAREIPNTVNNMNSAAKKKVAYLSDMKNWQKVFAGAIGEIKGIGANIGDNLAYLYSKTNSGIRLSSRVIGIKGDELIEHMGQIGKKGTGVFSQFKSDLALIIEEPEIVSKSISLLVHSFGDLGSRFASNIKNIAYVTGESVDKAKNHFIGAYKIGLIELSSAYKYGPENIVGVWQEVERINQSAKNNFENSVYLVVSGINSGARRGLAIIKVMPGKVVANVSRFTSVSKDTLTTGKDYSRKAKEFGLKLPSRAVEGLSNYGLAIKNGAREFKDSLKDGFSLAGRRLVEKIRTSSLRSLNLVFSLRSKINGLGEVWKSKEKAGEIGGSYFNFKKITSIFGTGYNKLVDFWYEGFFEPQIVEIPAIIKEPGEVREVSKIVQPTTEVTKKTISEVTQVEKIIEKTKETIASADLDALRKKDEELLKEIQRVGNELILLSGYFTAGLSTAPNAPLNVGSNGFNVEGHTNVHSLSVNADLGVGRDLSVSGSTVLGTDTTDLLTVRARSIFNANADFNSGLDVASGGLTVGGNNFTIDDSGNLTTSGSITITGTTTLSSALNVGGDLNVDGNTTLGNATSSDLVAFNSRINSGLQPAYDNLYDLGNGDDWLRWRTGYFGTSVGIGGTATTTGDALTVSGAFTINPSLNLIASSTSGNLIFATNGLERARITSEGITGIGTTTPTGLLNIASADPKLYITDTNADADKKHWWLYSNAGDFQIGTTSDSLATNATFLTIKGETGNVGIGTIDPTRKFEVSDDSAYRLFRLSSNHPTGAVIEFNPTATGGVGWDVGAMADAAATGGGSFAFTDSGGNVRMVLDSIYGRVGIGTTTPTSALHLAKDAEDMDIRLESDYFNWTMGIDNSDGGKFKIASSTALGTSDRFVIDGSGNIGIGTSSPTQSLVVNGSTYITGGLGVGIATTSPGVIQASGDFYMSGNLMVLGNATVIGSTLSDTLTVNATINSDLIPDQNAVRDLGSAAYYWKTAYIGTANINNLAAASTTISGTSNESFTINSNNATADAEDMNLIFYRGTVVPNALITWDSTNNKFDFNQAVYMQNDSTDGATISLEVRGLAGQSADLLRIASSTGDSYFNVTSAGNVGIGTTTPQASLQIASGQVLIPDGSLSAPGLGFGSWTNTGIITPGNGHLQVVANGASPVDFSMSDATFAGGSMIDWSTSANPYQGTQDISISRGAAGKLYVGNGLSATDYSGTLIAGNVGIGTTSPFAKLSVTGTTAQTNPLFAVDYSASGTATSTALLINSSGYVGIGTASPAGLLHIEGLTGSQSVFDVTYGTYLLESHGGIDYAAISFTSDYGTFNLTQAGTTKVRLTGGDVSYFNAGNVGIGTTSPTYQLSITSASQQYLSLEDSRYTTYWARLRNDGILSLNTSGLIYQIATNNNGPGGATISNAGTLSNNALGITTNNIVRMYFDTSGNVGIGTTSPGAKLEVYGSAATQIAIDVAAGNYGEIFFKDGGLTKWRIGKVSDNKLRFYSDVAGSDIYFQNIGNVGIGTTTPYSKLSVWGSNTTSDVRMFELINSASTTLAYMDNAGNFNIPVSTATTTIGGGLSVAGSSGLTVLQNGNVGIGTAEPREKLEVYGGRILVPNGSTQGVYARNADNTNSWRLIALNSNNRIEIGPNAILNIGLTGPSWFSSSDVGIGTTTPRSLLNIAGTKPQLTLTDTSAGLDDKHWFLSSQGGNLYIGTSTDALNATSTYLTITKAGNVGIGTTDPGTDQVKIITNKNRYFSIWSTTDTGSGIQITPQGDSNVPRIEVLYKGLDIMTRGNGGTLTLSTTDRSTDIYISPGRNFIINTPNVGSNVGIGTTTPFNRLTIAGINQSNGDIGLTATSTAGNFNYYWTLGIDRSDAGKFKIASSTALGSGDRFVIDGAGNVGIGTTSPNFGIDVEKVNGYTVAKFGETYPLYITRQNPGIGFGVYYDTSFKFGKGLSNAYGGYLSVERSTGDWSFQTSSQGSDGGTPTMSTKLTILNGGNVGIGTTSPGAKLDVYNGNIQVSPSYGLIGIPTGSIITPDDNSVGAKVYSGAYGDIRLGSGSGGEWVRIKGSSGNVGIGTTSPGRRLTVDSGGVGSNTLLTSTTNTSLNIQSSATNNPYISLNLLNVSTTAYGQIQVADGAGWRNLIINPSGGYVGIGTTSPQSKLEVYGNTGGEGTALARLEGGNPIFYLNSTSGDSKIWFAKDGSTAFGIGIDVSDSNKFKISTNYLLDSSTRLTIDNSGNVGIGTTSPSKKLQVIGDVRIGANGEEDVERVISSGGQLVIHANDSDSNNSYIGLKLATGDADATQSAITFYTKGTSNQRMIIHNDGNVGIGGYAYNDAPPQKLSVVGGAYISGNVGIGTTSPFAKLSVTGTTAQTNPLFAVDYSASGTATSTALLINSSGNVGIGTAAPRGKLTVAGGGIYLDNNKALYARDASNTTDYELIKFDASNQVIFGKGAQIPDNSYLDFGTSLDFRIIYDETTDDRLEITDPGLTNLFLTIKDQGTTADFDFNAGKVFFKNDGNVGIGTTSPGGLLHLSSADNIAIRLESGTDGTGQFSDIMANTSDTSDNRTIRIGGGGDITSARGATVMLYGNEADTYPGDLFLRAGSTGDVILDVGNVGIGTTSPQSLLSVGNANGINFSTATSTFYATGGINLTNGCYAIGGVCITGGGATLSGTIGQTAYFSGTDTAVGTSTLFISTAGYVGIGTTSPSEKLTVNGYLALAESGSVPDATSGLGKIYATNSWNTGNDSYTKLLLHADFVSNHFFDSSSANKTITVGGNATQISTSTRSSFGGKAAYFDGTGDYLVLGDSADWAFGSGDFTIDTWVYFPALSGDYNTLASQWNATGDKRAWALYYTVSVGAVEFNYTTDGSAGTLANPQWLWTPSAGQWYHIAIVRNGANLDCYINGTKIGSTHNIGASSIYDSNDNLYIGTSRDGSSYPLSAYLDEYRISKGTARWTANFTAPSIAYEQIGQLKYKDSAGNLGALWNQSENTSYYNFGSVGIGTTSPATLFAVQGNALADAWLTYDIAEMNLFPSVHSSGGFEQGELLTIDSTGGFVKANSSLNMPIIGVAKSVELWGSPTTKPAILGTFTLKVSNANGDVKAGDRLTMSSIDGVAVKAIAGGEVVGYALEDFDNDTPANVKVFVSSQWYSGTTTPSTIVLSGEVHASGFVNSSTREVKENIEYLNEQDYDEALESILGTKVATYNYINDQTPMTNDQCDGVPTSVGDLSSSKEGTPNCSKRLGLIAEESPKEVLSADGKGVDLYKMVSLAWAGMKAQQNQIDKLAMSVEELRSLMTNVQIPMTNGDGSPNLFGSVLSGLRYLGTAIENNWLKAKNLAVDMLYITKKTNLPQETSVGEAMIRAGNTVVIVPNKLVKTSSQIFLTPKTPLKQSLAITGIIEGESFKVELAEKESQDIHFNWWIVGVEEQAPNNADETQTNAEENTENQAAAEPSSAEATEGEQGEGAGEVEQTPVEEPEPERIIEEEPAAEEQPADQGAEETAAASGE